MGQIIRQRGLIKCSMSKTTLTDKNGAEILEDGKVFYTDQENKVNNEEGYTRWNAISSVWEVIRKDIQTGTQVGKIVNLTKI